MRDRVTHLHARTKPRLAREYYAHGHAQTPFGEHGVSEFTLYSINTNNKRILEVVAIRVLRAQMPFGEHGVLEFTLVSINTDNKRTIRGVVCAIY